MHSEEDLELLEDGIGVEEGGRLAALGVRLTYYINSKGGEKVAFQRKKGCASIRPFTDKEVLFSGSEIQVF